MTALLFAPVRMPLVEAGDFIDIHLRKYDADGNEVWTRQFGSAANDELTVVAASADGIYVAGSSMCSVPGEEGSWARTPVVRKYDPSGNESSTLALGSNTAAGSVLGLAADTTGVYAVGSTRSQANADRDAYVAKIGPLPSFTSVPAANYINNSSLAPASIASGFGESLAETTAAAGSVPLPTTLLGTAVKVRDSSCTERRASLFFVSPTQVNYLVPWGTAVGSATTMFTRGDRDVAVGSVQIESIAPALFSANAQGTGVAAASYLRVSAEGGRTEGLIFNPSTQRPVPIDLGPAGDQIYLSLFGSGIRGLKSSLRATVGGMGVPVLGTAAHAQYAGLDQLNIGPLPRSLAGRGEVEIVLSIDAAGDGSYRGSTANVVTVSVR